jgi:hypothetical protein
MSELQLKIAKGTSEVEILEVRGNLQTEQARMQELRLREIELQRDIEKRKIGNENVLMVQQNKILQSQITAHEQMLSTANYSKELDTHTQLYSEKLRLEEEARHQETILKQRRDADQTRAKIHAHKTHITHGHPNSKLMQQQIDQEVEKAARLEIDEEKQKQERIRLQDQQNVMTSLRRDAHQKGIQLRQLQAENKLLDKEHLSGFETEVVAQHQKIAQRDIEIAQRQDYLRLRRENEERQRKILEEDARIEYMSTPAFHANQKLSAAIAMENQTLQQHALEQKELHQQLRANQILESSANMARYAEEKNIPLDDVMMNISPHLDEMESKGIPKVEAVRLAGKRMQEAHEEGKRRDTMLARMQHYRERVDGHVWEQIEADMRPHYGDTKDIDEAYDNWDREQFDRLIREYENVTYKHTSDRVKFL